MTDPLSVSMFVAQKLGSSCSFHFVQQLDNVGTLKRWQVLPGMGMEGGSIPW